jgi:membrane peptidoglycan carboxypeptidase
VIARTLRVTSGIAALIRTGLIAGLIVSVLVSPIAFVGGLGAKEGAQQLALPVGGLKTGIPAQTTHVYAPNGALLAQFYEEYRTYVPLSAISGNVQNAIVAAEDARFWDHHGVDFKGVARAFVANHQAGGVSQGASTLTMQYVRNVLRDTADTAAEVHAATEQTAARKIKEMKLALDLEKRMSKHEILERYLNVAYFGHRAYGIQAAAEVYFSKKPADLTVPEAALLAGLVQAPSAYDPAATDQRAAVNRRNYVIDRMVDSKYLPADQAPALKAAAIGLKLTEPRNDCTTTQANWGFFCDMFRSWWTSQPAFGGSPGERLDRLRRGGYTVVTSIDPKVQAAAQAHIVAKERPNSPFALGLVAIEPGTGRVKAMAVNRVHSMDKSHNGPHSDPKLRKKMRGNYPNTVNPLLGGGDMAGYQAGSTFKMFTMLTALEQGLPLSTSYFAPEQYQSIYKTSQSDPSRCGKDSWCPKNAGKSITGRHNMWTGFGHSVNTYFVQLEQRVGADAVVHMAERLGLRWRTDIDKRQAAPAKARSWGAFTLGVADTTPLDMADAFASIAADGTYCEPLPVQSIVDAQGKPALGAHDVPVAAPRCHRVLSPEVARGAIDAARCVTGYGSALGGCGGSGTAPGVYKTVGRPVAGKTGTTDDNRSAWFVGMTPALTVAGFIADPDNPFHLVTTAGHAEPRDAVAETLHDALVGTAFRSFTPPPPQIAYGASGKKGKSPAKPRAKSKH